MSNPIIFVDLDAREKAEQQRLLKRKGELLRYKAKVKELPEEYEQELTEIQRILDGHCVADPLFVAVRKDLAPSLADHQEGKFPSQVVASPGDLTAEEKLVAGVYGILVRENQVHPETGLLSSEYVTGNIWRRKLTELDRRFGNALARARAEYKLREQLFDKVLAALVERGEDSKVYAEQWATVCQDLAEQHLEAAHPQLKVYVLRTLSARFGGDGDGKPSTIDIVLPDLERQVDLEIVADNLHAVQAIYFAAMLEELKMFQAVEKLVELFQLGVLPLGKGKAGDALYGYWKKSFNRISEVERRNLYARTFGLPGGDSTQGLPNREFDESWMRFISAVSSYMRQFSLEGMLRAQIPMMVSDQLVRKAGRDLAANLSVHGYGMAYFAATELQKLIEESIVLLSDPEVLSTYGARDMFQLVEQVSTMELGGARNSFRCRTMATAGAIIIRWLADHAVELSSGSMQPLLNAEEIRVPMPRKTGTSPMTEPTDRDLVDACEQWLAVTGTPEARIEEYSQPSEGPAVTTRPAYVPGVAREMLESVGITAGLGRQFAAGNRPPR